MSSMFIYYSVTNP